MGNSFIQIKRSFSLIYALFFASIHAHHARKSYLPTKQMKQTVIYKRFAGHAFILEEARGK
jgi:hypothetical protein